MRLISFIITGLLSLVSILWVRWVWFVPFIEDPYIPRKLKVAYVKNVAFTKPSIVLKVYQMMSDIHTYCNHHKIQYWVCFGSLLGAERNQGLIPWDDDLDVCIFDVHEPAFLAHVSQLKDKGYNYVPTSFGYRLFVDGSQRTSFVDVGNRIETGYPFGDIIIMKNYGDKIRHHRRYYRDSTDWQNCYLLPSELFPLKLYSFGALRVFGPQDGKAFLYRRYGHKWPNGGRVWLNYHGNSDEKPLMVFELTEEEAKGAATPFKPINKY